MSAGAGDDVLDQDVTAQEWLAPGRKTVTGYLHVLRGPMKMGRNPGIFDHFFARVVDDVLRERGKPGVPRYADCHAVWFGFDPDGPPNNNLVRPFLRYKASRPIDGLGIGCDRHRVELTCTVPKDGVWSNGMGAYITRATGRCLECDQ